MGSSQSTIVNDISNRMDIESITNVSQNNITSASANTVIDQSAGFSAEGSNITCTDGGSLLNMRQEGTVNILTDLDSATTNEISKLLNQVADNSSTTGQEFMSDLGGMIGTSISQNAQTEIKTAVKNYTESDVFQTNMQEAFQNLQFLQDGKVSFKNTVYTGPCNISLDQLANVQIKSMVRAAVESIANDETVQNVVNDAVATQAVEAKGLGSLVESIGTAIGAAMGGWIALVVVGVLIVFGGLGKAMGSGIGGILMALIVLVVVGGMVAGGVISLDQFESIEIPPDVAEKKCEEYYTAVAKIKLEVEKIQEDESKTDEEKKSEIDALFQKPENLKVFRTFQHCMNIPQEVLDAGCHKEYMDMIKVLLDAGIDDTPGSLSEIRELGESNPAVLEAIDKLESCFLTSEAYVPPHGKFVQQMRGYVI